MLVANRYFGADYSGVDKLDEFQGIQTQRSIDATTLILTLNSWLHHINIRYHTFFIW
jgi:hypothetical protein